MQTGGPCSPKFLSKIFARKKINTTSRCVKHIYTLSPKFSSVIKKIRIRFSAFFASVASILRGVLTIQSHFELLGIILQLFDKKVELSFLSTKSQDWMDPISALYFSLLKKRDDNKIILIAERLNLVLFYELIIN